ncbi:MAG: hypothetical protein ACFFDK_03265 [Promethearchaeota archaeon]
MIKKYRSGKIKLPIFEYSWSKEIDKEEPNIMVIQDQIDTFIFVIQKKENFKISDLRNEFKTFIKLMIRRGHLTRLEENYQDKFLEITKFVKEYWQEKG